MLNAYFIITVIISLIPKGGKTMMDVLVMDALMIGTLLAGFGLLRLFLGWCIDQTEGTGKKNQ